MMYGCPTVTQQRRHFDSALFKHRFINKRTIYAYTCHGLHGYTFQFSILNLHLYERQPTALTYSNSFDQFVNWKQGH